MNHFSVKRTGALIKKQWVENSRMYWISILALTGMLAIVFLFWLTVSGPRYGEDEVYVFGMIGWFVCGAIFASTSFNMLHKKDTGIYWISFPASHFEKLLVTIFFNVIVFVGVYLLCFFVLKFGAEAFIQLRATKDFRYSYEKVDWSDKREFTKAVNVFFYVFFVVQAVFVLGAASFKRLSFIFTITLIAGFIFLMVWYISQLTGWFLKGYNTSPVSISTHVVENATFREYGMGPVLQNTLELFLKFLLAPFLWLITWVKLKEKQI